ncbi:acyl-CoA dehydrogenase [Subtercola boreus]|uniref:Dibenzothiophene monooxygenase n=1 Tax=Subtercola boreus TaxID=120213 RepID=A0A3E0VK79_9MICO|nr:acyl-CoA dehydrogenase family protein [Subtercola boreus]RFA09898.1 acyl-CoA dehydrogenase [Subtercola boreus]TQL52968.1 alkylation response protein AidB-like acyl-CoA dehydrogenase [Subtercola boreus]
MAESSADAARFAEVFAAIAAGAVQRELDRELAHDAVGALKRSGFTALRVPVEHGGSGCSLPEFFALLVDLATADSNVAHLLRGHFAFVEILLLKPESEYRSGWLRAIANGAIVGNAASETTGNSLADIQTTLQATDDRLLLNGTKYYSTGTLYSSHVYVAAARGTERVTCVVPTDAPGVTMLDDWDGFGQRLTASGTTVFENVEVDPLTVANYSAGGASHLGAFFQLVLVSVAAGISAAVLADAVAFVQPRKRTYISANAAAPRDDPQVRAVIGELSALAFTGRALVGAAADALARATEPRASGAAPADRTALLDAAEIATYQAQVRVLDDALRAATLLFEVGGASATARPAALDRHWRNARTVASHNPAIYKYAQLGDWELNGVGPTAMWERLWAVGPTTPAASA